MTRYHLKYRESDFSAVELEATRKLFEAKPWRLDIGQLDLYQKWADVICEAAEVPPVGIQYVGVDAVGFEYVPGPICNILLGRYSLATLFCAVGAHLCLHQCAEDEVPFSNLEWAYSLFYVVKPVMFRRRVREGRIIGLTARDTFSRDTWDRLTRLGLTVGDDLVDPQFDIRTLDADDDLVNPDEVDEAIEADREEDDLAEVIELEHRFESNVAHNLRSLPITTLRRMSRGVVSGGYNMPKEQLVRELIAHNITEVPS